MADLAELRDDLDHAIEAIESARAANRNAPAVAEVMAVNLLIGRLGKPRGEMAEMVRRAIRHLDN